jgi:hypothetical protein
MTEVEREDSFSAIENRKVVSQIEERTLTLAIEENTPRETADAKNKKKSPRALLKKMPLLKQGFILSELFRRKSHDHDSTSTP